MFFLGSEFTSCNAASRISGKTGEIRVGPRPAGVVRTVPFLKHLPQGVLENFSVCLFGLFVCLFEFVCLCCFFFGEECSFFSEGGWVENPKRCGGALMKEY